LQPIEPTTLLGSGPPRKRGTPESAISDLGGRDAGALPVEPERKAALNGRGRRRVGSGPDPRELEVRGTGTARAARIAEGLGRDFGENAIEIEAEREGVRLTGFAGVPTFNRGNSLNQFAFVNGRPVQDKLIWSALRAAYAETIPHGRYPVAVLAIDIDPALVDVNVHPAKSDVRFRDPGLVRGLIIGAIREALAREGDRASTTGASGLMRAFRPEAQRPTAPWTPSASPYRPFAPAAAPATSFRERQAGFAEFASPSARSEPVFTPAGARDHFPETRRVFEAIS